MIPVSLKTLAEITGGTLHGSDLTLNDVTTDTRKVTAGSLFVALVGERFDAHDFAEEAIDSGAQALLVSKHLPVSVPQVVVEDTRLAFGRLSAWVRQQSTARVVALTGSSGKTSVKEMTAAILRECGETLYTAGNLNNDYGVPMTLLRLTAEHQYAVIELGANHQGEIAYTTDLVKPESALVNNLAAAHLEGFGSLANWQSTLQDKTVWRFSPQAAACDFSARDIRIAQDGTHFVMKTPRGEAEIVLPLPGRHNIANALAAAALALSVDAPLSAVQQGLKNLQSVPGRLFPVRLSAHQLLLDDSYNANVGSMTAAVQVLSEMPGYRVLVAGDMAELGDETEKCHREIGDAARDAGIDRVLSCGKFSHFISENSKAGEHFSDKTALTERLRQLLSEHSEITVLIKGSRSAAMEQVVQSLKEKGTC